MQNQYKSPLRKLSKSKSKLSKSVTAGKLSKYKQQSESKNNAAKIKEISDRQPYKNLFTKLLRSQNLSKFVKEAEKYVDLVEDIVAPYKTGSKENIKSRNESYEYGRALLHDGGFIKFYCKLVEREFYEDRKKIRQMFYEKYHNQICLREKMFFDYFKEEIVVQEDSNTFTFSKSKKKQPRDISQKKAKTELNFPLRQYYDKNVENLTAIDHQESQASLCSASKQGKSQIYPLKSQTKKGKTVHFEKQNVEEQDEEQYLSPFIKYNPKETEEERELRYSGITKPAQNSAKRKSNNIVKFDDQLKSNKKLQEIYAEVLKEAEQREKNMKIKSNNKNSSQMEEKPVVRKYLKDLLGQKPDRIQELTQQEKQKFQPAVWQILSHYPSIHLLAPKNEKMITACRIEGRYKGYIVKKAVLTDHLHYPEKDYIAILAQKIVDQNSAETKECIFEPDERVEAFMLE